MPVHHEPTAKHPDRRRAIYTDVNGKKLERVFRTLEAAERELVFNARESSPELRSIRVPAVIEWWKTAQRQRQVTPAAVRNHDNILREWLGKPHADLAFGALTIEIFTRIQDDKLDRLLSSNTVFVRSALFTQFVREAMERGFIHWNPAAIAALGVDARVRREVTPFYPEPREIDAIRAASYPLILAAVDCMSEAGATPAEILRILPGDCRFRERKLMLRGTPTVFDPEGSVLARHVAMTDRLAASLLRLHHLRPASRAGTVFGLEDGSPRNITDVQRRLQEAQTKAGIVRRAGHPSGRTGRKEPRKVAPGKTAAPFAKYDAVAFRHAAAVRWAEKTGVSGLADRLGITAAAAEKTYGYIYDENYMLEWVIENPPGY